MQPDLPELVTLVGAFVGSAFTLLKLGLSHYRSLSDRFVGFLEASLVRQEQAQERLESALDRLAEGAGEQTQLLRRLAEQVLRSDS